jgi:hypothetical protein
MSHAAAVSPVLSCRQPSNAGRSSSTAGLAIRPGRFLTCAFL